MKWWFGSSLEPEEKRMEGRGIRMEKKKEDRYVEFGGSKFSRPSAWLIQGLGKYNELV